MSFRFILKPSNTYGDTFKTVDDFLNAFDPRINSGYRSDGKHFFTEHVFRMLNAVFSQDNLRDYDTFKKVILESPYCDQGEFTTLLDLFSGLSDNQRFLIGVMRRHGPRLKFEGGAMTFRLYTPSYVSTTENYLELDYALNAHIVHNKEEFLAVFNTAYEKWHRDVISVGGITKRMKTAHLPFANSSLRTFFNYMEGYPCVKYETRYISPKEARDLIQTEAEVNFTVAYENNVPVLKLTCPLSPNNRRQLYQVFNYSTDVLSILSYPNVEPKEKEPILVGVELEVSTDYTMKQLVDAAEVPFFLGKQDSSINGCKQHKVELVTAPSSFKFLRRQYAKWFNNLDYNKFDVSNMTNNGMHVHVGRDHFEDNTHIRNFCWFFNNPANKTFLFNISEREVLGSFNTYSPMYTFQPGTTRTYAFKDIYRIIGRNFRGITNFKGGWENAKTVEVRLFRGIVSYATIVKNLDFVESVFYFTKDLTSYRQLTLRSYIDWLDEQPKNKYILLRKFLDTLKMKSILIEADVKDIIFMETNPERIIKLLQNAPFELTEDHILHLNGGDKRFVFDRKTKQLTSSVTNRGKLYEQDVSYAQRYLRNNNSQVA